MFSKNLKSIRRAKGLSQEQLAVKLNVVRQTVSKWEKGLSVPDAELLIKLSAVLNVSVDDLLGTETTISANGEELGAVDQIKKLNELLEENNKKASALKKKIGIILCIILFAAILCAVLGPWSAMWHEFGKNLYH